MSIRFKMDRPSAPYEVIWRDPVTKKRHSKSFKDEEAAKRADEYLRDKIKNDRAFFERKFAAMQKKEEKEKKGDVLFSEVLDRYSRRVGSFHISNYAQARLRLGKIPIKKIRKEDIEQVKQDLLAMTLKPVTVRDRMRHLKTVFLWAMDEDLLEAMPKWPKSVKGTYEKLMPPTQEELKRIYDAGAPVVQRALIIGANFGVRIGVSELLKITWENVHFDGMFLRIFAAKKNPNAPWRDIPIREDLIPLLKEWQEEDEALGATYLVHKLNGTPISARHLNQLWAKALRESGITRRIRPYDLRHAFATNAIAAGADIGTVAKLMGHTNANMVLSHYQYVTDQQKRTAVNGLPSFF